MDNNFLNKVYLTESDKVVCQKYNIEGKEEQEAVHNLFEGSSYVKIGMNKMFTMLIENYVFCKQNDNSYNLYSFNKESGLNDKVSNVTFEEGFDLSCVVNADENKILDYNKTVHECVKENYKAKLEEAKKLGVYANISVHPSHITVIEECLPLVCDTSNADKVECDPDCVKTPCATFSLSSGSLPQEFIARINDKVNKYRAIQAKSKNADAVSNAFYAFTKTLEGVKDEEIPEIFALEDDNVICYIRSLKQIFG